MASTSSSAAVAAMVERASQEYLKCRRSVTDKVEQVKQLDEQIAAVFQQISALSEAPEGQEELSEEAKATAKSVGRLEVTLAGVEGEEPVPNATITVTLDPEYEADEYETVEEVVEKKDVVVTDEHGHVVEDGQVPEEDGESTPRKLKTTTKITRTIIKKRVKKEKEPVVRTVAWTAVESEEDETLTFPATFVFDPVQSREAVVIVTVAAAAEATEEEEEVEPVREIEIPISSLFQDNALDKWYTVSEEEEEEPTTITELVEEAVKEATEFVEEAVKEAIEEEVAAEKDEEAEKAEEDEKEEAEKTEEKTEDAEEVEKADEAEKVEESEKTDEAEKTEEAEKSEEAEIVEESEKVETAEEAENAEESEDAKEAEKVEEPKPVVSRFHVKANFVLSEAEKLSISVVALSKKKQEVEAALHMLEREAASLRTKYDRLTASQRQMSASSISKPKSNLLGGRFGAGGVPVQRKSWYQSSRERANAFITKNQQVLVSVAMFTGSVLLFHYNGENLLA